MATIRRSHLCALHVFPFILIVLVCVFMPSSARHFHYCQFPHHSSFSFPDFGTDRHSFALLGDAQVSSFSPDHKAVSIQVSGSQPKSVGWLFYSKPIRLLPPSRFTGSASFSTFFSFSMFANEGDGLAFVISPHRNFNGAPGPWLGLLSASGPATLSHSVAIEFDSKMDKEVQDPNANHVGVDVGSLISVVTANVSDLAITLNSGERLYAWIDYHSLVKVLEVRLSKSQTQRPSLPILTHEIDLSKVCKEEMHVGFSSSTGDSPQKHIVYSWSFTSMHSHMHSHPGNPHFRRPYHGHPECHFGPQQLHSYSHTMHEIIRIATALVLGALCGSVTTMSVLLIWTFVRRQLARYSGEVPMRPILIGYQQLSTDAK